ncbi:hypothetical protein [Hymenobacter weizhouensis]|uniref:hypothetical protein n=1 Tax=Hymenobacter sp. YIM 151500-1 TaxID=2987689 RepID=UPI002226F1CE|nr:hypothetical protein [Hymenobacter sp. YIM 151500-1]UYZ63746.1 hypothetical protein OIS53_02625 [Hymenobacter sp. YIM 151500-1]
MDLAAELQGLPQVEAAFYARLGLRLEVCTLADVSDWVDEVILREDVPESFFIQLYRLLRTGQDEVVAFLTRASGPASFSVRPGLGWLRQAQAAGWPLGKVIKALYRLRTLVESDREVGWIYGLAADYERAAGASAEALREVQQETEAFLACYRDYTFRNRPRWPHLDDALEQRLAALGS